MFDCCCGTEDLNCGVSGDLRVFRDILISGMEWTEFDDRILYPGLLDLVSENDDESSSMSDEDCASDEVSLMSPES